MFEVNTLLAEAISETNEIKAGEIFLVKDLFKGYFWNRIPRRNRLLLGTLFLSYVNMIGWNLKAIERHHRINKDT